MKPEHISNCMGMKKVKYEQQLNFALKKVWFKTNNKILNFFKVKSLN